MTIGERIKEVRKRKGMTRQQLADKIGATKESIYKYETGIVKNIPIEKIIDISVEFNLSPDYFLGFPAFESTFELKEAAPPSKDIQLSHIFNKLSDSGQKKVLDYSKLVLFYEQHKDN